jgi:hypothetical protein
MRSWTNSNVKESYSSVFVSTGQVWVCWTGNRRALVEDSEVLPSVVLEGG